MLMMPRRNFGFDLFDEMFKDPFFSGMDSKNGMMKTDIKEQDGAYLMDIDLPGFQKEDINAELHDGYMTITAQKNESNDRKDEDGNYIHRERYSGSCSRTFYVGEGVTEEDINAKFENGILTMYVPKEVKKPQVEEKFITIE